MEETIESNRSPNLDQVLKSMFFDSRHPSLAIDQFGGTPGHNLQVKRDQVQKLAAPLELFGAPKDTATPRLRTTGLKDEYESCC